MGATVEIYAFSREGDFNTVMSAFDSAFEDMDVKYSEGNLFKGGNEECTISIPVFMTFMNEDIAKLVKNQKDMVSGHFAQVENCNEDIKINLIHYLQQCQTFVPIRLEISLEDEKGQMNYWYEAIDAALEALGDMDDGVLLINGATIVLNPDNEIILSDEGTSQVESYFPFEVDEEPERLKGCTRKQLKRRTENMELLFDREIYVIELPLNDDDDKVTIRTKEEMLDRTIATFAVSLYSEAMMNPDENMSPKEAREFVNNALKSINVDPKKIMSPDEWEYFNDDNSEEKTRIKYSWNYEHLYTLEWALGLDEWTEPTEICDVPKAARLLHKTYEELLEEVEPRSKKEILDMADLVYRMDWACVDARIHGMGYPGGLEGGVVQARHKTLNWLIGFENADWDDVSTPT